MAHPIPVADQAVGMAALIALLDEIDQATFESSDIDGIAAHLIAAASKVRFQPSTRQLVMTFDLAMRADGTDPQ